MRASLVLATLVASAVLVSGCGGSGEDGSDAGDAASLDAGDRQDISRTVADLVAAAGSGDQTTLCNLVSDEYLTTETETPRPCPDPENEGESSEVANILKAGSVKEMDDAPALVTADIGASDGGAIFIVENDQVVGALQHQSDAGSDPSVDTEDLDAGDTSELIADSRPQVAAVGRLLDGLAKSEPATVCGAGTRDGVIQVIDLFEFVDDDDYPESAPSCEVIVDRAVGAASPDSGSFESTAYGRLRGFTEGDRVARADLIMTRPGTSDDTRGWFGSVYWLKQTDEGWRVMGFGRTGTEAASAYNPGS